LDTFRWFAATSDILSEYLIKLLHAKEDVDADYIGMVEQMLMTRNHLIDYGVNRLSGGLDSGEGNRIETVETIAHTIQILKFNMLTKP
jgi:hypothetical protein